MSDSDKEILGELYMICAENAQYIQNLLYKVEDERVKYRYEQTVGKMYFVQKQDRKQGYLICQIKVYCRVQ